MQEASESHCPVSWQGLKALQILSMQKELAPHSSSLMQLFWQVPATHVSQVSHWGLQPPSPVSNGVGPQAESTSQAIAQAQVQFESNFFTQRP